MERLERFIIRLSKRLTDNQEVPMDFHRRQIVFMAFIIGVVFASLIYGLALLIALILI